MEELKPNRMREYEAGRLRFARTGPNEFCTGSIWLQPDMAIKNQIAQYDPGCLWKNRLASDAGKLEVGRLRFDGTRTDDSCTPALCFQNRSVWPQPEMAIRNRIRSGPVLHNMIRAICERTEPILPKKETEQIWKKIN